MKIEQVEAQFPTTTIDTATFLRRMFTDPHFQQTVQEKMGHTKVNVGEWLPTTTTSTTSTSKNEQEKNEKNFENEKNEEKIQKTTYQRTITFEAPVQVPPTVQSFLNLKTTSAMSRAILTVIGAENCPDRLEGSSIMSMLSGALKDNMTVHVDWSLSHVNCDKSQPLVFKVEIRSEFRKKVPMVQSVLEKTSAAAAKKTYETWIGMANEVCKQYAAETTVVQ